MGPQGFLGGYGGMREDDNGNAYWQGLGAGGGGNSYGGFGETFDPSGGAYGSLWQKMAWARARNANESRYGQVLQGYNDLYNRSMGHVNQIGAMQRRDIGEQYNNMQSKQDNDFISRGLSSSTVALGARNELQSQRQASMQRLDESLAHQRLEVEQPIGFRMLDFMGNRNDKYPNYNPYAGLYGY